MSRGSRASTSCRWAAGALAVVALADAALIHLGRTYGSTEKERAGVARR
jgi:hypothetical protein